MHPLVTCALLFASTTDDARAFHADERGWSVTAPAGWSLTLRTDEKSLVEVAASSSGVKGNIILSDRAGATLATLKASYEKQGHAEGARVVSKPKVTGLPPRRVLTFELEVDYGGVRGRTYDVAVEGPLGVVEVAIPGAGPAADYTALKKAVDAIAAAIVFTTPAEKPWAHKKNPELLHGKLCSSATRSLTFDGAGHVTVEPDHANTYYALVGDDAKLELPGGKEISGRVEVSCNASTRDSAGRVTALVCGLTTWSTALCGP